jgi:hypothetical protein
VPPGDLVRAVVGMVPALLADLEDDTRNVLLTLARIVVTVETGEIVAKDEAADLVIPRLDEGCAAVLRRARDAYHGPDYGSFDDLAGDLAPCVDALTAAIDAAAASRPG